MRGAVRDYRRPQPRRVAPRGPEDRILVRHVDLVGVRSGIRYAQAESHIAVDRLPNTFHTALAREPAGIGAALQAASAESYRQLLFYVRTFDCLCARR